MDSEMYSLLNKLLNPKKFSVVLSLMLLLSAPAILEVFFIVHALNVTSAQMIITLESLSALIGYVYLLGIVKIRIHRALGHYREKRIYRLVGSFPVVLYLLNPGFVSLILGIILLSPMLSACIGRKIIHTSQVAPSIIYTLLELNNAK